MKMKFSSRMEIDCKLRRQQNKSCGKEIWLILQKTGSRDLADRKPTSMNISTIMVNADSPRLLDTEHHGKQQGLLTLSMSRRWPMGLSGCFLGLKGRLVPLFNLSSENKNLFFCSNISRS